MSPKFSCLQFVFLFAVFTIPQEGEGAFYALSEHLTEKMIYCIGWQFVYRYRIHTVPIDRVHRLVIHVKYYEHVRCLVTLHGVGDDKFLVTAIIEKDKSPERACRRLLMAADEESRDVCMQLFNGPSVMSKLTFSLDYRNVIRWPDTRIIVTSVPFFLATPCLEQHVKEFGELCCYLPSSLDGPEPIIDRGSRICDKNRCVDERVFCDLLINCEDGMDEGVECSPIWVWVYVGVVLVAGVVVFVAACVLVRRRRRAISARNSAVLSDNGKNDRLVVKNVNTTSGNGKNDTSSSVAKNNDKNMVLTKKANVERNNGKGDSS